MVAAEEPAAAVAEPAGVRAGILAQQELRHALGQRQLADAARRRGPAARAAAARCARRAIRGSAGSRHALQVRSGVRSSQLCGFSAMSAAVASMTRMRAGSALARARYVPRTRSKKARSSLSKRSSFFPDAGEPLARDLVAGNRTPACGRARGRDARWRSGSRSSSTRHALAGALVGAGRVGEAVADHPAPAPRAPGAITCATWSRARREDQQRLAPSGPCGCPSIASRSRSARSVPPGSRVDDACWPLRRPRSRR